MNKDISKEVIKQGLIVDICNLFPILNDKELRIKYTDEVLSNLNIVELEGCLKYFKNILKG